MHPQCVLLTVKQQRRSHLLSPGLQSGPDEGFKSVVLLQEFDSPQTSERKAKQYDGNVKYWRAVQKGKY